MNLCLGNWLRGYIAYSSQLTVDKHPLPGLSVVSADQLLENSNGAGRHEIIASGAGIDIIQRQSKPIWRLCCRAGRCRNLLSIKSAADHQSAEAFEQSGQATVAPKHRYANGTARLWQSIPMSTGRRGEEVRFRIHSIIVSLWSLRSYLVE